jgi:hypothetical protein
MLVLVAVLAVAACGSVQRPVEATVPPRLPAPATVSGHVSWPGCSNPCPPVDGIPVHFADAVANRTLTAVSDRSGAYAIQLPPGSYVVIAGDADRSPDARRLTVHAGDAVELDLPVSLPTGA